MMRQSKVKLLAFLLTCLMVWMPVLTACDQTDDEPETTVNETEEPTEAETEPVYSEGLEFTSNGDGTCYVSGLGECRGDWHIVIPPVSPDGDAVTGIGDEAFTGNGLFGDFMTHPGRVTIPEGVTYIGNKAFYRCINLTSVNFPESLTSIGNCAFYECPLTSTIFNTLPSGLTHIGVAAFSKCDNLMNISLPNGIKVIEAGTFEGCKNLASITLPNGLAVIEQSAFEGCVSLASITIPETVTEIQPGAINECVNLKDIYFLGTKEQWNQAASGRFMVVFLKNPNMNSIIHCTDGDVSVK